MRNAQALLRRWFALDTPAVAAQAQADALTDGVGDLDLAFVIDTTGSMGGLIAAAQQQMIAMLQSLAQIAGVDLRLGIVEYRDHPPQDKMVYRVHPFTGDLKAAQTTINKLKADGGGDGPEAVFDGIVAAARELAWRPYARRVAVLMGDAPPHGVGAPGDSFRDGCPCGETIHSVTAAVEVARVTLYAVGLTATVADSFEQLSRLTGGEFFPSGQGDEAINRLRTIMTEEFSTLEFDRQVLAACRADEEATLATLAERLASKRGAVAAAVSRLGTRQLL